MELLNPTHCGPPDKIPNKSGQAGFKQLERELDMAPCYRHVAPLE